MPFLEWSDARDSTARSENGGRRSPLAALAAAAGGVPSQTSDGAAVPGVSALTATESAASSATTKLDGAVGKRVPTAMTRAVIEWPLGSARCSRPPGPAAAATSRLANTATGARSDGWTGRTSPSVRPSSS